MALYAGKHGAVAIDSASNIVSWGPSWSMQRVATVLERVGMQGQDQTGQRALVELVSSPVLRYRISVDVPLDRSGAADPYNAVAPGEGHDVWLYDHYDNSLYWRGSVMFTQVNVAVNPAGKQVVRYTGMSGTMYDETEEQITPKFQINTVSFWWADPEYRDGGIPVLGKTLSGGLIRQGRGSGTFTWPVLYQNEYALLYTTWDANKSGRVACTYPPTSASSLDEWQSGYAAFGEPIRGRIAQGLCYNVTMAIEEIGS